jgi:hypothetical protein
LERLGEIATGQRPTRLELIDVSAYHLGGFQNLLIGANASGDAVVFPPAAGGAQRGPLTLVGVHPLDLTASDFHF